jgi:L-lactate dehydrogenase complex protein LldG
MTARSEIIRRVQRATVDMSPSSDVPRSYRQASGSVARGSVALFVDRLVDYGASAFGVASAEVSAALGQALARHDATRVVVPGGFPHAIDGVAVVRDHPTLSRHELDALDAAVTTCALAIADTGTIVLDAGPGQGRRAVSLLPDLLVVVVRAEQIVAGVPEAIALLDPTRPLTWISGPSATSDIEMSRVVGVHGPRRLEVAIVD